MSNSGLSPYKEATEESPQPPAAPNMLSLIPKVMGGLHLAIGGFFVVSGLLALMKGGDKAVQLQQKFAALESGGVSLTQEAVDSLSSLSGPIAIVNGFDLLASVLMLIAGLGLVRYKRWGRLLSNLYVVVTLLVKSGACYVFSVLATPFYIELVEAVPDLSILGAEGVKMVILGVVVLTVLYPVVTVVVVNLKACRLALR